MTLPEFKAWFEGFTEDLSGPPNKKQWARIQERVAEITGQAISYPVYIDRYVRPLYGQLYNGHPYGAFGQAAGGTGGNANAAQPVGNSAVQAFNSCNAMNEVGRADARSLAA